jgi:alpha-2-macroglobulin
VPRLRILTALPARDVDSADRFSLVFDEPVAASGLVGSPLTDSPFVIAPAISGQWAWASADKLEYRLDAPLPPGRRFVIKPAASLERLTGRRLIGAGEFKFETRPLRMERCELVASDRTHATLEFRFNQPVAPTDLIKSLELTDSHRARLKDVAVLTQAPATKIQIHASRPESGKLHVHLAKALTGSGGELSMPWDIDEDHEVQPRFALLRSEIQDSEFSSRCTARLHFSRVLDDRQKLPTVKVNPEITGLVTRISEGELLLEGRFRSGQNYTATVSGNLLDKDGETLGEDQSSSFGVPDRRPWVGFTIGNGILSPQGNLTVDVTAVNVGGMEIRTARVYANNIVGHLRGESRRAVGREMPVKTVPLQLARNEVSTMALDLRELLKTSEASQPAASQPAGATLSSSAGVPVGIYCVQASATDQTWTMGSAIIAITDLGITAKAERDGYLVWVTSLRNATPVSGVMVNESSRWPGVCPHRTSR